MSVTKQIIGNEAFSQVLKRVELQAVEHNRHPLEALIRTDTLSGWYRWSLDDQHGGWAQGMAGYNAKVENFVSNLENGAFGSYFPIDSFVEELTWRDLRVTTTTTSSPLSTGVVYYVGTCIGPFVVLSCGERLMQKA